jgi:hypothetical protein
MEENMKKLLVITLAVLLVGAFTVPATAVDHEFGGYWRTRMYNMTNFSGDDSGAADNQQADTRTRLYYTAVLSDEVKLVNKFEMDATFGDGTRGDIGADGQNFEVKNSYADFNLGDFNIKLGTQGKCMARGFIFCDDFTGAIARYVADDMVIPFIWIKAYEGGTGDEANDFDVDYYAVDPVFSMGDLKINPHLMYIASTDASAWSSTNANEEVAVYFLGVSVDYAADMFSAWFTGIYEAGSVDLTSGDDLDVAATLAAVGGSFNMDALSIHAQAFYATGDDDTGDGDANDFFVPKGASYYWAEIMGYGTIDQAVSAGSPADQITNITALNVGVDIPMDKLNLTVDIWNANLVEDNAAGDTELGTEIDVTASYQLLEDLKLTVLAAYLSAGDATGGGDENPTELGAMLSLSF